jgi:putative transposase
MRRAFKYRLRPTPNQERELCIMLETHRRLYNSCLKERKTAWEQEQRSITFNDQRKWYTEHWREHPYYSRLNNNSADQTIKRLDLAFQAFFRRVKAGEKPGYPRFKGRDRFDSILFGTYPNGLKLIGDRIRVQHVGSIKVRLHRQVEGKIKTATLKREAGKWYVVFSCDLGEVQVAPSANPQVGIDMGLTHFLTTSDDTAPKEEQFVENPRYLKSELPELRRRGRAISRKKRGGKNRRKAVEQLQKVHVRVKNLRKEHHFKIANKLVHRYGKIAVEDLDIRGMLEDKGIHGESRTRRFSRSISDAGWGQFLSILGHKAESAGVRMVKVEPRGTSQQCSGCGAIVPKTLWDRVHHCPHCGLILDRDVNAARNVEHRGFDPVRIGPADLNSGVTLSGPRSSALSSPVLAIKDPEPSPARTRKSRCKPLEGKDAAPLLSDS